MPAPHAPGIYHHAWLRGNGDEINKGERFHAGAVKLHRQMRFAISGVSSRCHRLRCGEIESDSPERHAMGGNRFYGVTLTSREIRINVMNERHYCKISVSKVMGLLFLSGSQ